LFLLPPLQRCMVLLPAPLSPAATALPALPARFDLTFLPACPASMCRAAALPLQPFNLTKSEVVQLINHRPPSEVEVILVRQGLPCSACCGCCA
jgi:hypothetical protein